jgi:hypothetical protein
MACLVSPGPDAFSSDASIQNFKGSVLTSHSNADCGRDHGHDHGRDRDRGHDRDDHRHHQTIRRRHHDHVGRCHDDPIGHDHGGHCHDHRDDHLQDKDGICLCCTVRLY